MCEVCFSLFAWWFDTRSLLQQSGYGKTGGLELASTITLVLQANRLTKCASHPKFFKKDNIIIFAKDLDDNALAISEIAQGPLFVLVKLISLL